MRLTPRLFIDGSIGAHEGGYSDHPEDNGNWFDPGRYAQGLPQKRDFGTLVGSTFGVTAYAFCSMYGLKTVTAAQMKAITRSQAVDIGEELFFNRPGFNKLVWNRVTASIFDKAWGSGPGTAIKMLQRELGLTPDGKIGQVTPAAYNAWITKYGEETCAIKWCNRRIAFDTALTTNDGPKDPDLKWIGGWNNRSRSFLPGTVWWKASA